MTRTEQAIREICETTGCAITIFDMSNGDIRVQYYLKKKAYHHDGAELPVALRKCLKELNK